MNERVLITGASGFLGYHIIHAAIEKGLTVFGAVRKNSNIEHLRKLALNFLYLDYNDVEGMGRQLAENNIDYIIHAAGDTKAITQQGYDLVNATYTLNLAKAAKRPRNNIKKFVFISSLAATGPLPDAGEKITEATPPKPVTGYGRSKLLAEQHLAVMELPTIILRPTAIYGPRDKNIFIMIRMVARGMDPYIGRTSQQLSFVHAADVADLSVSALFAGAGDGIYNITDGNSYNRYQLADIVKDLVKRKARRFHIPLPLVRVLAFCLEKVNGMLRKPSVINREKLLELAASNWACDISKAKKELGFAPKFDLASGLRDTVEWYKANSWL
jgi:UDP-glucose 4-epimerase